MSVVALLVKALFLFPKLEGLLRRAFQDYEHQQYLKRHRAYGDVIDEWMRDAPSDQDEDTGVPEGVGYASVLHNGETDNRQNASLHQRPREQCPLNEKDCPFGKNTNLKKAD